MPIPIALQYALLVLVGLVFGSFGNVLIFRIPRGASVGGRSQCMHCGWQIQPWELIPILSFIGLRGKCRGCKKRISFQYPIVEALSAVILVFAFTHEAFAILPAIFFAAALWLLLLIAIIDLREQIIPDVLSLPFIACAVLWRMTDHTFAWGGIALGLLVIGSQWAFSRGRWMGSGDVILAVGLGALVGAGVSGLIWIFLSYILGSIVACILLLTHIKTTKDSISFAPFLALGAVMTLLFGEPIRIVMGL